MAAKRKSRLTIKWSNLRPVAYLGLLALSRMIQWFWMENASSYMLIESLLPNGILHLKVSGSFYLFENTSSLVYSSKLMIFVCLIWSWQDPSRKVQSSMLWGRRSRGHPVFIIELVQYSYASLWLNISVCNLFGWTDERRWLIYWIPTIASKTRRWSQTSSPIG